MVLVHNNEILCEEVVNLLKSVYDIQDRGPLEWILGMRVSHKAEGVVLSQDAYVAKILSKTGMSDCKPAPTPTSSCVSTSGDPTNMTEYRSIVGMLLHAHNCTRPDISFATNQACRHMQSATVGNVQDAKRIVRFLRGTPWASIKYREVNT